MRLIVFIILVLCISSCSAVFEVTEKPTDYSVVIENREVCGVIFSADAECFLCYIDTNRFTPTLLEIQLAEEILKNNIKEVNNPIINQGYDCPLIHKKLNHYRRQYFGYYDKNGDKILYLTFNWDRYTLLDRIRGYYKDESDSWKRTREMVLDGCSYHWEIKINLNSGKLFALYINGSA